MIGHNPPPEEKSISRALLLLLLLPAAAAAQGDPEVVFTSPPSPVGAGARAAGMASAFIAVADDATAASWNPAGLIQLERPEVSAVARFSARRDSFSGLDRADEGGRLRLDAEASTAEELALNYGSAALPFHWRGYNMVASINYQQMLDFDRELTLRGLSTGAASRTEIDLSLEQRGGVDAIAPAIAFQVNPRLSVGVAVQYWFDGLGHDFAWRSRSEARFRSELDGVEGDVSARSRFTTRFEDVSGWNATFGALWKSMRGWSVGAFVELPVTLRTTVRTEVLDRDDPDRSRASRDRVDITLPVGYGVGGSYRVLEELIVALDVTRVEWGDFRRESGDGRAYGVTGDPVGAVDVDAVTTVRLGAEYLMPFERFAVGLRAGGAWDPEPSRGSPEDVFLASAGVGLALPAGSLDLAYQFRWGDGLTGVSVLNELLAAPAGETDLRQHLLYLSLIVPF